MELGVVRLLADAARAAGRDPASDPIPGLRRDVLFTCTADEEAGGVGRREMDRRAPARLAARGRRAQRMRRRRHDGRRPAALPDPGRREGLRRLPDRRPRDAGATARCRATTTPPCSRPRSSARLAVPGPTRITPVMARFLEAAAAATPREAARSCAAWRRRRPGPRRGGARGRLRPDVRPSRSGRCCATRSARTSSTPASSTTSSRATPRSWSTAASCPGRPSRTMRAQLVERLGPELAAACDIELIVFGSPVEAPADGPLFDLLVADDPRPRPRRDPAAGHGAVWHGRQVHRRRSACRPTGSRRSCSTPRSASSSASTGSMSASRWRPCGGACRSCTTWSAASAADGRTRRRGASGPEGASDRRGRR